ncbi:hypothetical protein JMJ35_008550 [Cladonia borealis]|uniref:Uncharacterized protein n=1 Tax=Cladonia borealis TaxID=184061 RepID=A0AA39QWE9_9LECA|nr:hypothetical protein JMJ35_008550 [Cladonia borealis]
MTSAAESHPGPGGFLQPTLPSPPASTATSASPAPPVLPRPRANPLKPGSSKESSFIDYVDNKLLGVSRRYEKRYNADFEDEATSGIEGRGYESFGEMAKDLEAVIDVVWVSGTPSLQTPYLLTTALTTCSCLPSFPFQPRPTFQLLHKLDLAFYSLLQGTDAETGDILPGFEGGRVKLSTTEKVRMRGLVERTRVAVVEVAAKGGSVAGAGSAAQTDTEDGFTTNDNDDGDDAMDERQVEGNHGRWEMEVARVYERTIVELGMSLDASGGFG